MSALEINDNLKELIDFPMNDKEIIRYWKYKRFMSEEKAAAKIVKQRRKK